LEWTELVRRTSVPEPTARCRREPIAWPRRLPRSHRLALAPRRRVPQLPEPTCPRIAMIHFPPIWRDFDHAQPAAWRGRSLRCAVRLRWRRYAVGLRSPRYAVGLRWRRYGVGLRWPRCCVRSASCSALDQAPLRTMLRSLQATSRSQRQARPTCAESAQMQATRVQPATCSRTLPPPWAEDTPCALFHA
jgi:hypothetical protein